MADMGLIAQAQAITTGTVVKTLLQIVAPAQQRLRLKNLAISFNGVSNTATPIFVELVRQTGAGTMSALTLRKQDPDNQATIQSTAQQNATVEPTDSGDIPWSDYVHPQIGLSDPRILDRNIKVPGGGRLGLRVTAGASVSANARLEFEE